MLNEFKEFALRGNVVDLAIGIVIGAAFSAIVQSLVGDIFMPVIGAITGGLDFSNYFMVLAPDISAPALEDAKKQGAVLAWGKFLTVAINFIIVAAVLFLVVKLMNRLKRQQAAEPEKASAPTRQETLLMEIRDLLRQRGQQTHGAS